MFYHPKMISGIHDGMEVTKDQARHSQLAMHTDERRPAAVHRTLIPVDGSESANRAIAYIIRAARRGATSEIHLINVQPPMFPGDFAWDEVVEDERQARLGAGQSAIENARKLLDENAVASKAVVRFGRTAKTIVQYARENDVDAIVMGTRRNGLFDPLLRRSVAAQVARTADIPVMILNPDKASRIRPAEKPYDWFAPILAP